MTTTATEAFVLPAPSAYRAEARCTTCGHLQYPYALNPVFEDGPEGRVMVECYVGSAGDFCDVCEAKGLPALTMELIGWNTSQAYGFED